MPANLVAVTNRSTQSAILSKAVTTLSAFGFCLITATLSHADDLRSLSLELGDADVEIRVIQLDFTRNISVWFDDRVFNAGSKGIKTGLVYTAHYWDHVTNKNFGGSIGLRIDYEIPFLKTGMFRPYIEYGLGAALITETVIGDRDLSSIFHFRNQLGVGLKANWGGFFLRGTHLSNAGIIEPNDGIDIISAGVQFTY